jgi:hypothetical protein
MSEQAKIIAEIQALVMNILKTGTVSEAEGKKIDELEALLHQQKCFKELDNSNHANLGEEIATLFFNNKKTEAIEKMIEYEITPDDFFGFVEYHYDDDHEDELLAEMFTHAFTADINKTYQSKV